MGLRKCSGNKGRERGGLEGRFGRFYTWYFRKNSQYFRKFSWYFCFSCQYFCFSCLWSGQEREGQSVRNAAAVCPEVQMRAGAGNAAGGISDG